MKSGIAEVHVKRSRGKLTVRSVGKTPRGVKFLKGIAVLEAAKTSDPNFKAELGTAVEQLLD